jgi:hypothetical protein
MERPRSGPTAAGSSGAPVRRCDRATVMKGTRGRADVDQLLADRRLEHVTGAAADGTALLRSAAALLESARREAESNPEAAYVLAYDAARKAATSLVASPGRVCAPGAEVTTSRWKPRPRPVRRSLRRLRSAAPTTSGDRVPAAAGRRHRGPQRPRRRSLLLAESWTPRRSSGRDSSCIAERPAVANVRVGQ